MTIDTMEGLRAEVDRLNSIVATQADSIDMLLDHIEALNNRLDKHQMHHEAVEQLLDKPITRAIVERILVDRGIRDELKRKNEREARSKVIDPSVEWGA